MELRNKIIKNNDSTRGKQLKIIGVETVIDEDLNIKKEEKIKKKVTVNKEQLYFEFKKEEV